MSKLLARGFKAQAERLASAVREELGLTALDRLDPWLLADQRGVPVVPLSQLRAVVDVAWDAGEGTDLDEDLDAVSAVTVTAGQRPLVVLNDGHRRTRQASSLAHELAHLLLDHPARAIGGGRRWEPELEQEADWLGGALLVPEEAARVCAIGGWSDRGVAQRFGVSQALARWRLDATGARRVAAHVRAKRRRAGVDAQHAR